MPASPRSDRHLLLVAGTGRSGTSTLVGVLERHGCHVPKPEVAADQTNPRGFGEPRWVVELHGRLLRRAGIQVADSRPAAWRLAAELAADQATRDKVRDWLGQQFEVSDRLVVKDPRILWFLDLWSSLGQELGAEVGYVTMLRPPPETVGSRRTYYNRGLEDPHGIASWVNLMVGTEQATRGRSRAFVRYHDLLEDWSPVVDLVWRRAGLDPAGPPPPSADPADFIDPGLRRMRLGWDDLSLPSRLERLAGEAWACLDTLAAAGPDPAEDAQVLARLDAVRREWADYYAESESVAHSSVIAARQAARATPHQKPGASAGRGRDRRQVREQPRRASAARLVPDSLRRRLPARWRQRVRRRPDGGG